MVISESQQAATVMVVVVVGCCLFSQHIKNAQFTFAGVFYFSRKEI